MSFVVVGVILLTIGAAFRLGWFLGREDAYSRARIEFAFKEAQLGKVPKESLSDERLREVRERKGLTVTYFEVLALAREVGEYRAAHRGEVWLKHTRAR